jgi:osmotically inducible lipoprotein OsmB
MKFLYTTVAVTALMLISACGETTTDRALSGGGIGAGVGALGSGISGGSPMTGALVGGAVGAAGGALTDEEDINLGTPIWRR